MRNLLTEEERGVSLDWVELAVDVVGRFIAKSAKPPIALDAVGANGPYRRIINHDGTAIEFPIDALRGGRIGESVGTPCKSVTPEEYKVARAMTGIAHAAVRATHALAGIADRIRVDRADCV